MTQLASCQNQATLETIVQVVLICIDSDLVSEENGELGKLPADSNPLTSSMATALWAPLLVCPASMPPLTM